MNVEFIEIMCVTKDKSGSQVISAESISISDIKTFRNWHKGKGDDYPGKATVLVLKPESSFKSATVDEESKLKMVIINESYESFRDRLGHRVIVISK